MGTQTLSAQAQELVNKGQTAFENAKKRFFLGDLDGKDDYCEEAIESFEKALRLEPDSAEINCLLANVYAGTNEPKKAAEYYTKAIKCDRTHVLSLYHFGTLCYNNKEYDFATELFARALEAKPDFAPALFKLSFIFKIQGKSNEGLIALKQAARLGLPEAQEYLKNMRD